MVSESSAQVFVAGSINMDVVARVHLHPNVGETIKGLDLSYFPGGKGANQAVAASCAGAETLMLGAVGGDGFAKTMLEFLRSKDVNTDNVIEIQSSPTGTAIIIVDDFGENSIVVVPGANNFVSPDSCNQIEVNKEAVLVTQFETPLEASIALFTSGSEVGATCILNPSPAQSIPEQLLRLVDVLVVNEVELSQIADIDLTSAPNLREIRLARDQLYRAGFNGSLVTTLGKLGSITLLENQVIEIAGRDVEVVDTTGAGDCLVGYLAAGLASGDEFQKALETANVAASICVQRFGAGPSMPFKSEIN